MIVRLQRSWFAPNGNLYERGLNDVPDDFKGSLPGDAEVVDKAEDVEDVPQNIRSQPLSQGAQDRIGVNLAAETIHEAQKGVVPTRVGGAASGESTPTKSTSKLLDSKSKK